MSLIILDIPLIPSPFFAVNAETPDDEKSPGAAPYDLSGKVIGLAMRVHRTLGPGFLETVYRNALCIELADAALEFEIERDLTVQYATMSSVPIAPT